MCDVERSGAAAQKSASSRNRMCSTADVAGPLSPGLDPTSKGTLGKNLRYLMVAKYLVPKQFVEEFSGRPPPEDDGVGGGSGVSPLTEEQQRDLKQLFGEEQVAQVEGQLPVVEVLDVPTFEEEAREFEADEVAEYEPSEPGPGDGDPEEAPTGTADVTMMEGDCVHPELTYLVFAAALPNNQSSTVKRAVQDVIFVLANAWVARLQVPRRPWGVLQPPIQKLAEGAGRVRYMVRAKCTTKKMDTRNQP